MNYLSVYFAAKDETKMLAPRSKLSLLFFIVVFSSVLGFLGFNCSGYKAVQLGSVDQASEGPPGPGGTCPAGIGESSADPFHSAKVHWNGETSGFRSATILSAADEDPIIPQGTEVVVVVDHACRPAYGTLSDRFDDPALTGVRAHVYKTGERNTLSALGDAAKDDPCVLGVSNQLIFKTNYTTNDPRAAEQTFLPSIGYSAAMDSYFAPDGITKDVVIAIVDTGVDIDHVDLKPNIWVNTKEIAGNNLDDDSNGFVDDVNGYNFVDNKGDPRPVAWTGDDAGGETHGTHVAGLAAARGNNAVGVTGVMNQRIKIMSVNVFGGVAGAGSQALFNGVKYAADMGADVINLSLSRCGTSAALNSSIAYAVQKGVVVVVAAGNENRELSANQADSANCEEETGKVFASPASYSATIPSLISVGSYDVTLMDRSSFSNFGPAIVSLAAPGSDSVKQGLLSTITMNRYAFFQGTSMASPVVAGSAALVKGWAVSHGIAVTPAQIKSLILESARIDSRLQTPFAGRALSLDKLALKTLQLKTAAGPTPTPCP